MSSAFNLLDSIYLVKQLSFAQHLLILLDEGNGTISDLHHFLIQQNYPLEKTSLYRYFNPNPKVSRKPDERFLCLFSAYLALSANKEVALAFALED